MKLIQGSIYSIVIEMMCSPNKIEKSCLYSTVNCTRMHFFSRHRQSFQPSCLQKMEKNKEVKINLY